MRLVRQIHLGYFEGDVCFCVSLVSSSLSLQIVCSDLPFTIRHDCCTCPDRDTSFASSDSSTAKECLCFKSQDQHLIKDSTEKLGNMSALHSSLLHKSPLSCSQY